MPAKLLPDNIDPANVCAIFPVTASDHGTLALWSVDIAYTDDEGCCAATYRVRGGVFDLDAFSRHENAEQAVSRCAERTGWGRVTFSA